MDRVHGREPCRDRLDAEFFRTGFIHERRVEVAYLLGFRAGGIVFGRGAVIDDLAEVGFGLFRQYGESPVVGAVGRYLGLGQPRAVYGAKQIILGRTALSKLAWSMPLASEAAPAAAPAAGVAAAGRSHGWQLGSRRFARRNRQSVDHACQQIRAN